MCRLLAVKSDSLFSIDRHVEIFSKICKDSKEFQGHGWGLGFLDQEGNWKFYKNINPIWSDPRADFGETKHLIVHARSAFKDEGIVIGNNMPFFDGELLFAFNGELNGVRIKQDGRIGAEKIFNYIKRFYKGDFREALAKGVSIIKQRTRYVRAMNILVSDGNNIYISSDFSEDPDYFTLHQKFGKERIVCSVPYPNEKGWEKVDNNHCFCF